MQVFASLRSVDGFKAFVAVSGFQEEGYRRTVFYSKTSQQHPER